MPSRVATFPLEHGGDSLRGSSREFCAMYESMTQRCRILDCLIYVPADAVIRKVLVFIEKKA